MLHTGPAVRIEALPQEVSAKHAEQVPSGLSAHEPLQLESTPRSKTVSKLAALQMSSPGCTPSPMPLRRRLQQQGAIALTAPQIEVEAADEVICIDC